MMTSFHSNSTFAIAVLAIIKTGKVEFLAATNALSICSKLCPSISITSKSIAWNLF